MTSILDPRERHDLNQTFGMYAKALETVDAGGILCLARFREAMDMLYRIEELHHAFARTSINKPSSDVDQAFWMAVGSVLRGDL